MPNNSNTNAQGLTLYSIYPTGRVFLHSEGENDELHPNGEFLTDVADAHNLVTSLQTSNTLTEHSSIVD